MLLRPPRDGEEARDDVGQRGGAVLEGKLDHLDAARVLKRLAVVLVCGLHAAAAGEPPATRSCRRLR